MLPDDDQKPPSSGQVVPFQGAQPGVTSGRRKGQRNYRASAFPPEFMELFLRALDKEELFIPCAKTTAVNLRQKLYIFRKCLERENHPYARQLAKLTIQIKSRDGFETGLLISKQYAGLAQVLRDAGITPGEAKPSWVIPELSSPEDEERFGSMTSDELVKGFLSEEDQEGQGQTRALPPPKDQDDPPIEDL